MLKEAQDYILAERKSLLEAKALADSTSQAEIIRLQQQNALLLRLLESEKDKSERSKDELIKRISGLLNDFTAERDRSLREAFTEMSDSNAAAEKGMVKLGKQQGQKLEGVIANGTEWSTSLEKRRGELKRNRDGALKVFVQPLPAIATTKLIRFLSTSQYFLQLVQRARRRCRKQLSVLHQRTWPM